MIVELDLSERVYARLRDVAHARGDTVTNFLETTAYKLARSLMGSDEVAVLWGLGFTDKQMAAELGWTNAAVARRRQRLGLPANKQQMARLIRAARKESN